MHYLIQVDDLFDEVYEERLPDFSSFYREYGNALLKKWAKRKPNKKITCFKQLSSALKDILLIDEENAEVAQLLMNIEAMKLL